MAELFYDKRFLSEKEGARGDWIEVHQVAEDHYLVNVGDAVNTVNLSTDSAGVQEIIDVMADAIYGQDGAAEHQSRDQRLIAALVEIDQAVKATQSIDQAAIGMVAVEQALQRLKDHADIPWG